jgi:Flp pilus assembly protein TadG
MLPKMKRNAASLASSNDGTALVELAIVLPVFLFLLIGLIEIGRFAYYSVLAANAARAGAAYAAVSFYNEGNIAGIENAALTDGQNGQTIPNFTASSPPPQIFCSWSDGTADANCSDACPSATTPCPVYQQRYVEVIVSGTFNLLLGYPGLPQSVTVTGRAIMQVPTAND